MREYKLKDLAAFGLILILLEAASAWAHGFFPGEAYSFSPALAVSLICMVRWGAVGAVCAAIGGAARALLYGGGVAHYTVYAAGSLGVAAALVWIRMPGAKKMRASAGLAYGYCLTGYLGMCAGRAVMSALTGQGFRLFIFLSAEALAALVAVIATTAARRQDGLFEPQVEYIARIKQQEEERGAWNKN